MAAYREHISSGEPFDEEYRFCDRAGHVRWIHDRATLLLEPGGEPRSHGVMFDVTATRQA